MEARRPRLPAPAVKTSPALPEPDARSTTLDVSFQRYSFSRGGEKGFLSHALKTLYTYFFIYNLKCWTGNMKYLQESF